MSALAHPASPCEMLSWDSEFFGLPIARVVGDRLDAASAQDVDAWCCENRVRLLYFEARCDDPTTVRQAQAHGYGLVDVRVTLDAPNPARRTASPKGIRSGTRADLAALLPMARQGFRDSRFYFDPQLPDALCDALYERWVEESLKGYADRVLVAADGEVRGFVTCHLDDGGRTGRIGLIAVGEGARGQGVGEALVAAAQQWFASEGAEGAVVATQARNVGAQRLYNKLGFRVKAVSIYYHKWFATGDDA